MPVMFNIAVRIAKRCNAKLIMYNSEGYVLKEVLYNSSRKNDVWHIVLKSSLKRAYSSFMKNADYCIYSTEYIEAAYQKIYPHTGKSTVLYTVSEMEALPDESGHSQFELLYCGNLGVGRASVINRIAKILFEVDERAILSVYGRFVSEEDEKLVTSNHNVRFGGFVPYSKIPDLMSHASMLLHCENSERVDNLKYAFSTKIADCLASGRPFLVFADSGYPFVEYLKNNHCCHVSNTEDELRQTIKGCIGNVEFRNRFHSDAIRVAKENHSKSANDEKMYLILTSLIN